MKFSYSKLINLIEQFEQTMVQKYQLNSYIMYSCTLLFPEVSSLHLCYILNNYCDGL